jgi:hypothetical protein
VWVLLAIIAGGSLFGFFGMLIAVPVAAAIQVFARNWIGLYKASAVYRGEMAPAHLTGGREEVDLERPEETVQAEGDAEA